MALTRGNIFNLELFNDRISFSEKKKLYSRHIFHLVKTKYDSYSS